jgi:hypothetical protein
VEFSPPVIHYQEEMDNIKLALNFRYSKSIDLPERGFLPPAE